MAREGASGAYFRSVKRVRVLLHAIGPMLGSIIADSLAGESDVEVLSLDSRKPPARGDVDVILTEAVDPHHFEGTGTLLREWPKSTILVVSSSGREAVVYQYSRGKLVLGDVSPRTLVNVIRRGSGVANGGTRRRNPFLAGRP